MSDQPPVCLACVFKDINPSIPLDSFLNIMSGNQSNRKREGTFRATADAAFSM